MVLPKGGKKVDQTNSNLDSSSSYRLLLHNAQNTSLCMHSGMILYKEKESCLRSKTTLANTWIFRYCVYFEIDFGCKLIKKYQVIGLWIMNVKLKTRIIIKVLPFHRHYCFIQTIFDTRNQNSNQFQVLPLFNFYSF